MTSLHFQAHSQDFGGWGSFLGKEQSFSIWFTREREPITGVWGTRSGVKWQSSFVRGTGGRSHVRPHYFLQGGQKGAKIGSLSGAKKKNLWHIFCSRSIFAYVVVKHEIFSDNLSLYLRVCNVTENGQWCHKSFNNWVFRWGC